MSGCLFSTELRLAEQVSVMLGVITTLLTPMWLFLWRFFRSRRKALVAQLEGLRTEMAGLKDELHLEKKEHGEARNKATELEHILKTNLPEYWLQEAAHARQENNESPAIHALRTGFEAMRIDFAKACADLAQHHFMTADTEIHQRAEAQRLATIAYYCDPTEESAPALLAALSEYEADEAFEAGIYDPVDPKWNNDWLDLDLKLSQEEATQVSNGLLERTVNALNRTQYNLAERLNRRCIQLCKTHLPVNNETTLTSRYYRAAILERLSRFDEALTEIEEVIASMSDLAPEHVNLSANRHLRALILERLSRYNEALAEIEEVIALKGDLAPDDAELLASRHLRAFIFARLSRHDEALEETEEIILLETEPCTR